MKFFIEMLAVVEGFPKPRHAELGNKNGRIRLLWDSSDGKLTIESLQDENILSRSQVDPKDLRYFVNALHGILNR